MDYFPAFETMTRLLRIRRRFAYLTLAVVIAGAAAGTACGFWSPDALIYVIPSFLVASFVLLVCTGILTVWIRQCRAVHDSDWMERETER